VTDSARGGAADAYFVASCTSTCAHVNRQDCRIGLYCRVREGSSSVGYCLHGCACVCIYIHMLFYLDLSADFSLRHRIISEVVADTAHNEKCFSVKCRDDVSCTEMSCIDRRHGEGAMEILHYTLRTAHFIAFLNQCHRLGADC